LQREYAESTVYVHYVLSETDCPTCGYDTFARSGIDPDCPACHGAGSIKTYATHRVYARIAYPSLSDFVLGIAGGINVGDAILYLNQRDKPLFAKAMRNGYVTLDNERYAISSTPDVAGVGGLQEYTVKITRQTQ
jgi:hypothetical protein